MNIVRSGFDVARWIPAGLFVLVALVHLHQNRTAHLNPWLGGGFGMFSTTDRPWPRSLSIEAEDAAGKRYLVEWTPAWSRRDEVSLRDVVCAQPDAASLSIPATYALRARRAANTGAVQQMAKSLKDNGSIGRVKFRDSADVLSQIDVVRAQSDESAVSNAGIVRARARVWRLGFDGRTATFHTEPIGEAGEASRQP